MCSKIGLNVCYEAPFTFRRLVIIGASLDFTLGTKYGVFQYFYCCKEYNKAEIGKLDSVNFAAYFILDLSFLALKT